MVKNLNTNINRGKTAETLPLSGVDVFALAEQPKNSDLISLDEADIFSSQEPVEDEPDLISLADVDPVVTVSQEKDQGLTPLAEADIWGEPVAEVALSEPEAPVLPSAEVPAPPDIPEPPVREATVPSIDEPVVPAAPAAPVASAVAAQIEGGDSDTNITDWMNKNNGRANEIALADQISRKDRISPPAPITEAIPAADAAEVKPLSAIQRVVNNEHAATMAEQVRLKQGEELPQPMATAEPIDSTKTDLSGILKEDNIEEEELPNDIHSKEAEEENMGLEDLQSYPLYHASAEQAADVTDDEQKTLIVGQSWGWNEGGESKLRTIASIQLAKESGNLVIKFNDAPPEEKSVEDWKNKFAAAVLSSDGQKKLEAAKWGEIVTSTPRTDEGEDISFPGYTALPNTETAGIAYQDGHRLPGKVHLPEVPVSGTEAVEVKDAAEAEREKEVVKVEAEIDKVVQQVPAVAAEVAVEENGEADDTDDGKATGKENLPQNAQAAFDQLAGGSQVNMPVNLARQAEEIRFANDSSEKQDF